MPCASLGYRSARLGDKWPQEGDNWTSEISSCGHIMTRFTPSLAPRRESHEWVIGKRRFFPQAAACCGGGCGLPAGRSCVHAVTVVAVTPPWRDPRAHWSSPKPDRPARCPLATLPFFYVANLFKLPRNRGTFSPRLFIQPRSDRARGIFCLHCELLALHFRVAVISAKEHKRQRRKRQRRKRQSVTSKREKSQTPKFITAIQTWPNVT